ncbi:MAG: alpha/beta fold hydrolase [Aestuariibacter sp.]
MNVNNYFSEQGSGPPIIFIHGSYATTATWKKMVEQLAASHRCILIKLPGHCGTTDPDDFANPTIETELAIVEQVASLLPDEPIHLVGHSFGGVIALAQALKGNLNISQLSLFEPVAVSVLNGEMNAVVQKFLAKYRHDVSTNVPFVCGQVIDFWGGKAAFESLPDAIKAGMEPLVANNIRHWDISAALDCKAVDLQNLAIPTRLVCGTRSNPVAHAICEQLNKQIPHSKKYIIEGASHFLVTSHADDCLKALGEQSFFGA